MGKIRITFIECLYVSRRKSFEYIRWPFSERYHSALVRAKSELFLSHDVSKVPYLRERHEKLAQDIQLVIKMGIKTGEFKNQIDVNSFAELLIALIDGVMLHHCYQYSSSFNLLEILGLIEKMIENSLS